MKQRESGHTCEYDIFTGCHGGWVGGFEQPVWLLIRPYPKTTSQEPVHGMKVSLQVMQPHPLPCSFYCLSSKGSDAVNISAGYSLLLGHSSLFSNT